MNSKAAEIENQGKGESHHSVGNNNLPRIMLGNENAESSGPSNCSSREEKHMFRVMFTIKPLGFDLIPSQNGMGAKVGMHSNKHLKQDIPRGTELFAIGDTKLVDMKHEEIMRLLDEAKLPVNLTFKKVKKRVRILTPRSENLLQSGKKSPEVKTPSSFPSVDLGLTKLPSEEFKERAKENAAKSEAQKPKQGKTRQQKRREYMQRQRARQAARLRQRQERNQQRFQNRNNAHYQNRNHQRFDRRAPNHWQQSGPNHWQQSGNPRSHRDQRYEHIGEPRYYRNPRQQNYNREPRFEETRRTDFAHRRSNPQNGYQHNYPERRIYSRDHPQQRFSSRDYPQQRDYSRAHPQRRGYDRPRNLGQRPMDYPMRGYEPRSEFLFSDENIVGRLGRGEQFEYQGDRYMNRDQHRQRPYHKEYRWKSADELYKPRRDPARVMNLADFAPRKNNGSWSEVSSPLMLDSSEKSSADGHDSCSESGASTSKQSVTSNETQELTMKELNATLVKLSNRQKIDRCNTHTFSRVNRIY